MAAWRLPPQHNQHVGRVFIESGFHVTLMIAGTFLALAFTRLPRQTADQPSTPRATMRPGVVEPQLSGPPAHTYAACRTTAF